MAYHESTLKGWFTTSYNIREVSRPSGGPWGGAYIDDHYKELLGKVLPRYVDMADDTAYNLQVIEGL